MDLKIINDMTQQVSHIMNKNLTHKSTLNLNTL